MKKNTFEEKIKAVKLAKEKGIDIASEHLNVSQLTLEAWINDYSGENLYRRACEYAQRHGIKETANILGVSVRTFYRIRNKYGNRSEKKDNRRKIKTSYKKEIAEMSKVIGNKETARKFGTNVDIVYRARRDMLATNPNKKNNILWEFIIESKLKSKDICEICNITRASLSNYASKEKTSAAYRKFITALIVYKMHSKGKINDEIFKKYWNKSRSDVQNV